MPKKERARERRTSLGRVVYDRPRHFFGDRDLYRIARALLERAGDDSIPDEYDVRLGAYFGTLILTLLRGVLEWFEKRRSIQKFLLAFIFKTIPGFLEWVFKFEDIKARLLKALWVWIGDALAGARPADIKEEDVDD